MSDKILSTETPFSKDSEKQSQAGQGLAAASKPESVIHVEPQTSAAASTEPVAGTSAEEPLLNIHKICTPGPVGKGKSSRKISRKGKGKALGKRKRKNTAIDDCFCPGCNSVWNDTDEEPWIGCTNCEEWWHRNCAAIDDSTWEVVSKIHAEWKCPFCV